MDADEELARKLQAEEDAAATAASLASLRLPRASPAPDPASRPAPVLPGWQHPEEAAFIQQVNDGIRKVKGYEDELSQAMALSVMDLDGMTTRAAEAASLSSLLQAEPPLAEEDGLAMELLSWFKLEFFSWVDRPACSFCQCSTTQLVQTRPPTTDEAAHLASRTEVYFCSTCGTITRFPRYNDPVKLLETRRGRCGEWANCFALCCRAAGLDTRLVLDWTDHIWVEYYSTAAQKWIHMDPCEAALDKPLLYEVGWGKKLSYLIAVGREGVADVSKRYTRQYNDLLTRRPLDEAWVAAYLNGVNGQMRAGMPMEMVIKLEERDAADEAAMNEALKGPLSDDDLDLPGRMTGSAEWVASRGEGGEAKCSNGSASASGAPCGPPGVTSGTNSTITKKKVSAASAPGTRYQWARDTMGSGSSSPGIKSDLQKICGGVVRASGENAPGETAAKAFDGSVSSKWLDFGGCQRDAAWLEYRILPTDEIKVLMEYSLTSGDDAPERDPEHVVLEAWEESTIDSTSTIEEESTTKKDTASGTGTGGDKGKWVVVDERQGVRFQRRGQRLEFKVGREVASRRWRLRVVSVLHPSQANSVQLACWDLYTK